MVSHGVQVSIVIKVFLQQFQVSQVLKTGAAKARAADPSWPKDVFHTIGLTLVINQNVLLNDHHPWKASPGTYSPACCDCHTFTGAVVLGVFDI